MSYVKTAWQDGAADALGAFDLAPKKEKSTLRKALPWLAAAGVGAAVHKSLRTPTFSSNPALRKIQEQAASKGFHRVVEVGERANSALSPVASLEGKMTPWNKLKFFLNEGTTEAIPLAPHGNNGRPAIIGGPRTRNVSGIVHGRDTTYGTDKLVRGGTNIEGPTETLNVLDHLAKGGKRNEANFLQAHAPGSIPETHTDLSAMFAGLPADRVEAAREVQKRITATHGDGLLLKPNAGLASDGKFPRSETDWAKHVQDYDTHLSNPANRRAFDQAEYRGRNDLALYMKQHGLYEGHVLSNALADPTSVIAQKLIQNPLGEYRVHTVSGEAPSELALPRYVKSFARKLNPFKGGPAVDKKKMLQFVNETTAKLPAEYRNGNFAYDVMPHQNPDGTVGYKILEMNPTERATPDMSGGMSGLLDPSYLPFAGHAHYRAATGRHTPLLAGLGAAGAAGVAGLGTRALTRDDDDER